MQPERQRQQQQLHISAAAEAFDSIFIINIYPCFVTWLSAALASALPHSPVLNDQLLSALITLPTGGSEARLQTEANNF